MRLSSVFKINVLFFTFVFTNLALSSPPNTFDIPLEIEPIGVIASDINGDGVDDLVVDAEDGVGIIIADGQGGFMPPDYLLGEGLIGVADVNEDGFCDIITNRAVILGSANGHWTIGPSHDRVEGFSAISDFDGDGHIDVIVRYGSGSGSFRIYYGDGKGHFIKDTKSYSTYDRFTVGDLNQDGKPDIVMGYYDELYIFLNLGNRNWSDPCEYSLDNEPSIVYRVHQPSLADITGDGIIDIIVGHYWKNDIKLLKGNGDGTFKDFVKIADFGHVGPTATTDFDNDGIFDVVASGYYGENFDGYPNNSLMIVYGDSSEQFDANDSLPFGSVHKDVTTGDFNKDGWEDIAVASWGTNSISILFNDGTGSFSTPSLLFGDYLLEMSADFDSDGYKDIIVSRSYGSYRYLFIAYGKMDGTFEEPKALSHERTSDFVIGYFDEMLTFGVEGNPSRTLDVAYAIYTGYGPRLYVVLNEGSRQWSNPIRAAGNHYMNMMITGDFNEDGYQDIIDSGDPFFKYKIRFLAGNGNGTFQIQDLDVNGVDILAKAEMVDKDQSAVDIDNDGHLDIVAFPKMGTRGCWIGWGKGDGRFDFAWDDRILGRTPPWGIWLADINGDELPDIMDVDSIWLNSGSRLFYNALDFGGKPDDINGDGILDLIKTYRDEGCIEIRLGDGHSGWSPAEVWVHGGRLWGTNVFYGPPDNPVQNVLIRQYTYPWSSILKNISWKQANPWVGTVVIDTCGPRILDYIGPLNPGFTIAPTEFVLTFSEPIDPATVHDDSIYLASAGADGLLGSYDDIRVSGLLSYDDAKWEITFTPDAFLAEGPHHFVALGKGVSAIRDIAGNELNGTVYDRFPSGNGGQRGSFFSTFYVVESLPESQELDSKVNDISGEPTSPQFVTFDSDRRATITGYIKGFGDKDCYFLGELSAGDVVTVDLDGLGAGLTLEGGAISILRHLPEGWVAYASEFLTDGFIDSHLSFPVLYDGEYVMEINSYSSISGNTIYQMDGMYSIDIAIDSAISPWEPSPQTFFLDFDGSQTNFWDFVAPLDASEFDLNSSQTNELINSIIDIVTNDFAQFSHINITTAQPLGEDFSRISTGLSWWIIDPVIDSWNLNSADEGLVNSYNFWGIRHYGFDAVAQAMANTISHQIGHLLGLQHVSTYNYRYEPYRIMNDETPVSDLIQDQYFSIGRYWWCSTYPGPEQDSVHILEYNTGPILPPPVPPTICSLTAVLGVNWMGHPAVKLEAHDVVDSDGTDEVLQVEFHYDRNANNTLDIGIDEYLGEYKSHSIWFLWIETSDYPQGEHIFLARAMDNDGAWSNVVSVTVTINEQ